VKDLLSLRLYSLGALTEAGKNTQNSSERLLSNCDGDRHRYLFCNVNAHIYFAM
jgi:hypothetical protein